MNTKITQQQLDAYNKHKDTDYKLSDSDENGNIGCKHSINLKNCLGCVNCDDCHSSTNLSACHGLHNVIIFM